MHLVLTVLEIVAPVFLLAAVGFAWVRLGHEYRIRFVTQLAMTLAVPCLIFTALMKMDAGGGALGGLAMATIAGYGVLTALSYLAVRLLRLDLRTYMAPLIFGNTGNLGLPLALLAFGQTGLGYAVVILAIGAVWSFTFGLYIVAGRGSGGRVVREPMVWASLLGALFLWQGWQTPRFLTHALDLIGQMAIPLMLITLGVAIARLGAGGIGRAVLLSLLKLALCLPVAWGIGRAFGLDPVAHGVLVVQLSTPVAVTSYLLAEKYGADSESVAALVVASTLLSVIALPVLLGIVIA